MGPKKVTILVVIAAVTILLGYDVVWIYLFGKDVSISFVITRYSHLFPAIPFAFGFLMGHFFAQNQS